MGNLTALKIKNLTEPGRYPDGDGLFLKLNGKGSGRWLLRVQSKGIRREFGLGSLKGVSLADARDAAFFMRKKIAQGIDPVEERKQARRIIPTFRDAAKLVHEEHEKAWERQAPEPMDCDPRHLQRRKCQPARRIQTSVSHRTVASGASGMVAEKLRDERRAHDTLPLLAIVGRRRAWQ